MSGSSRPGAREGGARPALLPLALAGGALLAALVAALAPSRLESSTYVWPPKSLPASTPARGWYTPLLLTRHEPESISARLPCRPSTPLPRAERPLTVLATERAPGTGGGLHVVQLRRELVVYVGPEEIARLALSSGSTSSCAYVLRIAGGHFEVNGGPGGQDTRGTTAMPVVSGLFSAVDLGAADLPSIDVTTTPFGSRSTLVQTALRVLAALAAIAALLLVSSVRRSPLPGVRAALRRAGTSAAPVDAVVGAVLIVWWVVGPAFFDDGWVVAGQRNFAETGNLSTYYDSFGASSSLQYWLFWVEHWLFESANGLVALRLPALLCLGSTWVLCRWIFGRLAPARRAGLWALATGFLVGALAWGMTLRPEPVVALLATGVAGCTVLFLERRSPGPLAVAAVLVVLAVSAHPAALLTVAPLVVVAPELLGWARARPSTSVTIVLAGTAVLVELALLGSDLAHFRTNVASLRAFGVENAGWRDELTRYSLLDRDLYGAPLRRLWVALALLAVLSYLLRRRDGVSRVHLGLPAAAVGVSLLLLIPTPAKLPWHFGGLIGLAALALGAETARLTDDGHVPRWHARPFVVVGTAMLAAAWAWSPRRIWSDLDLRTLNWTLGLEDRVTLAKVAGAAPVVLLVVFAAVEMTRRRDRMLARIPWRAAAWTVPVVSVPLLVFTVTVFVADAAKTSSWTLTRQNLETLTGDLRCGVADDSKIPDRATMRPLASVGHIPTGSTRRASLPPAPANGLDPFALAPSSPNAPARSAWFGLPRRRGFGFFLAGAPSAGESIELEWGRRPGGGNLVPFRTNAVAQDLSSDARPELGYWRFYSEGGLPVAPTGAAAVRFVVRTTGAAGAGIGFTEPVRYQDAPLSVVLERGKPTLVVPNLLVYVPCVEQPVVRGIAGVPKQILAFRSSMWPLGTGTSPFDEVTDLYPLVRLPLSDSTDPPGDVALYVANRDVPGFVEVAPGIAR